MAHLIVQLLGPFKGGHNHLAQHRLFLLQVCQLFLEIAILLLLVYHSKLQASVQGLHQRSGRFHYLLPNVLYLCLHRV